MIDEIPTSYVIHKDMTIFQRVICIVSGFLSHELAAVGSAKRKNRGHK